MRGRRTFSQRNRMQRSRIFNYKKSKPIKPLPESSTTSTDSSLKPTSKTQPLSRRTLPNSTISFVTTTPSSWTLYSTLPLPASALNKNYSSNSTNSWSHSSSNHSTCLCMSSKGYFLPKMRIFSLHQLTLLRGWKKSSRHSIRSICLITTRRF